MTDQIKGNLAEKQHWLRFLSAVFFAFVFMITASLLGAMTLVQYGILLLTGSKNSDLADFCAQVIGYQTHVATYATLNTEQKPFPFGPWPGQESRTANANPEQPEDAGDAAPSDGPAGEPA